MKNKTDQNFDSLSSRFRKNIYDSPKGKIRLNILSRDLEEIIPDFNKGGLSILDAGAGQGNFALKLAMSEHTLTLCDLSSVMLADAEILFKENQCERDALFIHSSVQELPKHTDQQYDVVLFHAVLEWLTEPEDTLRELLTFIKPNGYLSLMFYSRTGLIYQNLTRGNFDYILDDDLAGEGKSLTPTNPLNPDEVYSWLEKLEMDVLVKSGVRVFYDGMSRERRKQINIEQLFELEERFSRVEPYCSMARYVHVLCRKT